MSVRTGPTVRLRKQRCPTCRSKLDAATVIGDRDEIKHVMPAAGDVTACIYCGEYLTYSATMRVRKAGLEDLAELTDAQRHNLSLVREFAKGQAKH